MQNSIKYIATAKNKVLCLKGWVLKSKLNDNQIKLFKTPAHIKQYIYDRYINVKYKIQKVRIRIEVLEKDVIGKLESED